MGNVPCVGESRPHMKFARWSVYVGCSLALLGAFFAGGTSAGATTASQSAPTTAPCPTTANGTICISQVSDGYTATTITLTMTVGKATDPTTDTNWSNSSTVIKWALFSDGSTTQSYGATEGLVAGQFVGAVTTSPANSAACGTSTGVTATVDTAANTYAMSFPSSCVGSPSSLALEASWSYTSGGSTFQAAVPATGGPPCCSVTPDPAATTGSSTTTTSSTTTSTTTSSTTTTTVASSTTTTTTSAAAVVSSPSSTGNTGSGLALTGLGHVSPVLIAVGVGMIAIGILGRRRFMSLARRAKRSRVR